MAVSGELHSLHVSKVKVEVVGLKDPHELSAPKHRVWQLLVVTSSDHVNAWVD